MNWLRLIGWMMIWGGILVVAGADHPPLQMFIAGFLIYGGLDLFVESSKKP